MVSANFFKVSRSKKGVLLLIIYAVCSIFIISSLKSKMYPRAEECHSYNVTKWNSESAFDCKIDTYLRYNFTKSLNTSFNRSSGWFHVVQNTFVYSAYIDRCPSSINLSPSFCVIFVSVTSNNDAAERVAVSSLNCALKRKNNVIKVGFAFVEELNEHHLKQFTAAFYYCDITSFLEDLSWPDHASLYDTSLSTWVPVNYSKPYASSDIVLSLCVRPMHGHFSSSSLTEFLAYYSTMGVDHFIFYHQNVSESSSMFLKFIESSSLSVEILPWNFPLNDELIHAYGQIAFTQDCILRSKHRFSHTIIVDLDEFIVPKLHSSIIDLVWYLDDNYKNAGSFSIPMSLFCDEFSLDSKYSALFHTFSFNRRQKTRWSHGVRSKYIAMPSRVQYGGVHFVWKHEEGWYEVKVPDSVASLNHYRHCCGIQQYWFFNLFSSIVLEDDVVVDNSILNFSKKMISHNLVVSILNATSSMTSNSYC